MSQASLAQSPKGTQRGDVRLVLGRARGFEALFPVPPPVAGLPRSYARTLRDINLDLAIIGADGIHSDFGFTTYNSEEAYTNRVLIERAREVWIVADRSKLGQVRPAIIHDISVASLLITDSGASPDQVEAIRQKGTKVICV